MECFSNCCRLCRSCNESTQPWNHLYAPHNAQLVKQIRACTGVQISESDALPKWICDRCMTALDQAYCFRIQCKETDACWRTQLTLLRKNVGAGMVAIPAPLVPMKLVYVEPEVGEVSTEQVVKEEPRDVFETEQIVNEEPQDEFETERVVKNEPPDETEMEAAPDEESQEEMELTEPLYEPEVQPNSSSKSKPKAKVIYDERRNHGSSWNNRLQCRFCPKHFGRPGRLREHEMRHTSERTIACLNCNNKYFTEADMLAHVERIHATDLPHGCEECGKRFLKKGQLVNHAVTHAERRPFTCEVCHKSFKNKYYLKYHLGLHEKKFQKQEQEQSENDEQTVQESAADGVTEEETSE
ncbi:hypothetical protein quinque_000770 [Culex quinquefasciatus]